MAIVPISTTRLLPLIKKPIFWAVFICALVHVSGAIGMVFFNRQAFLELTAVNLLLMFTLLYWIEERITAALLYSLLGLLQKLLVSILDCYLVLMFTETFLDRSF